MNLPTKEEIKKFLDVFDSLSKFEAEHRVLRNWGLWNESELPFPEVLKVVAWLKNIEAQPRKIGYMDAVDFDHELEGAMGGINIYSSLKDILAHGFCAKKCGVVKVDVLQAEIALAADYSEEEPKSLKEHCLIQGEFYKQKADALLKVAGNLKDG